MYSPEGLIQFFITVSIVLTLIGVIGWTLNLIWSKK